jgi:hypothetical protein
MEILSSDVDSNSEDDGVEDSQIDEDLEICELEKRDFENEEGMK